MGEGAPALAALRAMDAPARPSGASGETWRHTFPFGVSRERARADSPREDALFPLTWLSLSLSYVVVVEEKAKKSQGAFLRRLLSCGFLYYGYNEMGFRVLDLLSPVKRPARGRDGIEDSC